MNVRKRIFILALIATVAAFGIAPSFAARAIQGTVGEVSAVDAAALGSVGFRIWSGLAGGTTLIINNNVASCRNVRCIRGFVTNSTLNPGGYVGNQEATQVYNGDLPDQPFYELVDASMNDAASNHIGYYGVSGVTANNAGIGTFLAPGCTGTTATNCFGRIDSSVAAAPLANTNAEYGGASHTIRAIGGLNPIPTVSVVTGNACPGGKVCLSWNTPPTYEFAMRPSNSASAPISPVKGVTLYKNSSPTCTEPTGDDPGWVPVGPFDLGNTSTQETLPAPHAGCNYYALAVRLVGPAGDPNPEIETFRVGAHSQGVGTTPSAVQIVRFDAKYTGHGVVNVSWQSGLEGDVQGFYVTRSTSANGAYSRVSDLIRALGDNHQYATHDRVPAASRTYYYRLQVLDRDGSINNSAPAAVTLPARGKKAGPSIR